MVYCTCQFDINRREDRDMNNTTNQTTITVSTATAKPQASNAIKKVIIYNRYGRGRTVEKIRGIVI